MVRKTSRRDNSHPLQQLERASVRAPKFTPRGRIGLNTVIAGNESLSSITTDINGRLAGAKYLVPGYSSDLSNTSVQPVAALYNTGKFLPGTAFHWVPQASLSSTGVVFVSFTDNVETISLFQAAATVIAQLNIVRQQTNCKQYPLWQLFTMALPPVSRRKMYDVNSDTTFDTNALDRSCQGAFLYAVDGAPVSAAVCRPYIHSRLMLEGLKSVTT